MNTPNPPTALGLAVQHSLGHAAMAHDDPMTTLVTDVALGADWPATLPMGAKAKPLTVAATPPTAPWRAAVRVVAAIALAAALGALVQLLAAASAVR